MVIQALDSKISLPMFIRNLGDKFTGLLASTMTPEEKLRQIEREIAHQVQDYRVTARQIGAQMRAIADPDTKDLEPLEALKARRVKLVTLGSCNLDDAAKLGQIQQEIQSLDALIASQQATYDTLAQSYNLARQNYQTAFAKLEEVRNNGSAILKAIKAHQDAIRMRDEARSQEGVDTSFIDELQTELRETQAELRSSAEIDADLDATSPDSLDAELAALDAQTVDDNLMAEFRAAAEKNEAA